MDRHIGSAISLFVILFLLLGFIMVAPIGIAIYRSWQPQFTGAIIYGMLIIFGFSVFAITLSIIVVVGFGIYRRMKYSVDREHEHNWLLSQVMKRSPKEEQASSQYPVFAPPIDDDNTQFDLIGQNETWIK